MIVLVALILRLGVMMFLYPEQLSLDRDHWRFGYETGRIARSIAQGHGFGSPLFEETGPTAWLTPVYPYIVAGVFKVFGIYTKTSAFVVLSLNALLSALTCIPVFFIARKSFGDQMAKWAGWAWAFHPYGIYFPVERIWETWLSTLLLCLLFLIALHLEGSANVWAWIGFGLLWGLAALNSPVVLSVLPLLVAWICYRHHQRGQRWIMPAMAAMVMLMVVVTPWFVRDYGTFHRFIPFRDTLGLELRIGNNGDTSRSHSYGVGPWYNDAEWAKFKSTGEIAYMDEKRHEAFQFIGSHPFTFVWVSFRRIVYLWTGFWSLDRKYLAEEPLDLPNAVFCAALSALAFAGVRRALRDKPGVATPYIIVLSCFPLVYYFTHPEVYYMRPLDPIVAILAASALAPRTHSPEHFEGTAEVASTMA